MKRIPYLHVLVTECIHYSNSNVPLPASGSSGQIVLIALANRLPASVIFVSELSFWSSRMFVIYFSSLIEQFKIFGVLNVFLARIVPMTDSGINEAYIFGYSCYVRSFAIPSNLRMHVGSSPTVHIWTVKSGHGQIVLSHFCEQKQGLLISENGKCWSQDEPGRPGIFCCDRGRL